jgi:hypothetical protein
VTTPSTARPPVWAEATLRLLLRPADRESVTGDLLEEYRESIVPALGYRADRWYVKQLAGFLWRASWTWGALIGATLIVRYVFDTLVPATDYVQRSTIMSWTIMAVAAMAAFWNTWRTGHVRSGLLIAIAAGAIGGAISSGGSAVLLAIWHDPATIREWRNSGGFDEAFVVVPLIMIPVGATSGMAGALLGKCAAVFHTPLKGRG